MTDKIAFRTYDAREYADAMHALLPPGQAWYWEKGRFGDELLLGVAQELARIDAAKNDILNEAIELHQPHYMSWRLKDYQQVANDVLSNVTEIFPRKTATIGSHIGDRLWSINAPNETFPVPLVTVKHLEGPARIGSRIGNRLWGHYGRYILVVRYYKSVVDAVLIWNALMDFKQSHVFLWFEDITSVGGIIYEKN